jgi:PhnB protein
MAAVKPIPDNYPRVTPYLSIDGASDAIEFYKNIFGAEERVRMDAPGGKIAHAEIAIGDSMVMLADVFPDMGGKSPKDIGGSPVTLMVYVENVDDTYQRALDAGATAERKVEDQFYGDRTGSFTDPWGHIWHIATHVEDVSEEEMARRAQEFMPG